MDNKSDLAVIIEKLMNDPAAMEMVQKLKQSAVESDNSASDAAVGTAAAETYRGSDTAKLLSAIAPLLSGNHGVSGKESPELKRRDQLLNALKPYLSRERQDLIDNLTSLSGMSGVLEMLKGGKLFDGK